jgi:RNA-binding protein
MNTTTIATLSLTGAQKKALRGQAHDLDPIVHVGKAGLTEGLLAQIDEALEAHELIKIRFLEGKAQKAELVAEIESSLFCAVVGQIGHVAILFRQARDSEKRKIKVSKAHG